MVVLSEIGDLIGGCRIVLGRRDVLVMRCLLVLLLVKRNTLLNSSSRLSTTTRRSFRDFLRKVTTWLSSKVFLGLLRNPEIWDFRRSRHNPSATLTAGENVKKSSC